LLEIAHDSRLIGLCYIDTLSIEPRSIKQNNSPTGNGYTPVGHFMQGDPSI